MNNKQDISSIYQEHGVAFLAGRVKSLYDLIVKQGDSLLQQCGALTPSNCVSIILLLEGRQSLTSSEISLSLNKSHQLISQRLERLYQLGLITRHINKKDKRARYVSLSDAGKSDIPKLKKACEVADACFQRIYSELDLDLGNAIASMEEKLRSTPLDKY